MNMVEKYYVFLILFLSVLIVFAYGSSSDLKIQKKYKTTNEVVYDRTLPTSSMKDETSQIDIYLKYETSTTDFFKTIETTSESESTTGFISDESETTTGFTSNESESTTGFTSNESESTTGFTSNEPKSSTGFTSNESESTTGFTSNEPESTTGFTSNEPKSTTGFTSNESESTTGFISDESESTTGFISDEINSSTEDYTIQTEIFKLLSKEYIVSTEKNKISYEAGENKTSDDDFLNNFTEHPISSSSNIETTETTTINICETAELTHINVSSSPFSLNVSWTTNVKAGYCQFIYDIQLSKEVFYNSTTDAFILINYLNACENYEGIVSILYDNKTIHRKNFDATTSKAVDPVEQLKFQEIDTNFKITWLPSIRTKSCVNFYKWKYFQDEKLVQEYDVESTDLIIPQPSGCFNNTFTVLAAIDDSVLSLPRSVTYMDVQVNDPPIFVTANMTSNSATTKWTFEKICRPQSFLVKFTSDKENFTIVEHNYHSEDKTILAEVTGLLAFTNYSFQGAIKNEAGLSKWSKSSSFFQTKDMEPDAPEKLNVTQFANNTLHISWKQPQNWNGIEISYSLSIEFIKLNYIPIIGCPNIWHDVIRKEFDHNTNEYFHTDFVEPFSSFKISISAQSSGGIGRSIHKYFNSNEEVPDKPILGPHIFHENSLKNNYNVTLDVEWRTPCRVNGNISHYILRFNKCDNTNDYEFVEPISSAIVYKYSFENFLPDTCYNFIVQLHLQSKYSEVQLNVTSPAGIPDVAETVDIPTPNSTNDNPETTANVYIKNNMFNSTMGEIIYYAIIVAQKGCEEKPTSDVYSLDDWPKVEGNTLCSNESKAYEATKMKWNPFLASETFSTDVKVFTLGVEKNCTSDYCNRPLTPNTNYSIKIRGFTKKGFSDTQLIYFNTARFVDEFQIGLTVGLIVVILAVAFIIAAALFYTKGKLNFTGWPRMESTSNISPAPLPVPLKKFKTHYAKMIENSGKIKNEFQLLSTISSDVTLSTKTAMLPINRKKNRYINILPYDQTRVKLNDTIITASDYINASYIKGYSENNEYIATQGPTESTSAAFWQMIIEQNVKLIIMLTQFVESGKEKCHKYFPDLNSSQNYLNVITVECIEEDLLSNFNRRTFRVTKGKEVKTIIHLQFNLWPDFGVPHELDYIIQFNKIIKEIKVKKPHLIVMHCSAGVGRTGTLIALDILMQTIRDKRKVDIFGTVLNLRKQRMNMVQSEVQYEFLYQCVNYLLSDDSRNLRSSRSFSILQLDQIEENQITESNMLQTFKL